MKAHKEDYIVIKVGAEGHMKDLYENGTVYCNRSLYYKTIEDLKLRGDINEGTRHVKYEKDELQYLSIQPSDKSSPPIRISPVGIEIKLPEGVYSNIYCLYSIPLSRLSKEGKFSAPYRLREFGSHYVSFHNSKEFQNRVASALAQRNLSFKFGLMEYFDPKHLRGNISGFEKSSEYLWQSEARFFIRNPVDEVLILNIGPVKDIAAIYPLNEVGRES